jgi:hypothetical protein
MKGNKFVRANQKKKEETRNGKNEKRETKIQL